MIKQVSYFVIIGSIAFFIHALSLTLLIELGHMNKYIANVVAFLVAFNISYWGHRLFTFSDGTPKSHTTIIKFFATALVGVCINQAGYSFFLGYIHLHYLFSMFIAAGITAISTFIISKYYVFN